MSLPADAYKVWCEHQTYQEEPAQTKCLACFKFLQDGIDYAARLAGFNIRCVLTGPYRMATEYVSDGKGGYNIRSAK